MNVSRLHAKIVYNFQARCFELVVIGKNGVWLNGTHITPPEPNQPSGVTLKSQVRGRDSNNKKKNTVRTIYHAAKILFLGGAASSHPLKYINS